MESDLDLAALIKAGRHRDSHLSMPSRGGNPDLSDQQVLEIVGYLRSLK
jgi:hypothetical protein